MKGEAKDPISRDPIADSASWVAVSIGAVGARILSGSAWAALSSPKRPVMMSNYADRGSIIRDGRRRGPKSRRPWLVMDLMDPSATALAPEDRHADRRSPREPLPEEAGSARRPRAIPHKGLLPGRYPTGSRP